MSAFTFIHNQHMAPGPRTMTGWMENDGAAEAMIRRLFLHFFTLKL